MPKRDYQFWVYIMSNRSHILYVGVTNNIRKRVMEHRRLTPGTFTARYQITRLVYFEQYQYINNAITRETKMKHWTRAQKIGHQPNVGGANAGRVGRHDKRRFPSGMTNTGADPTLRISIPKGICV